MAHLPFHLVHGEKNVFQIYVNQKPFQDGEIKRMVMQGAVPSKMEPGENGTVQPKTINGSAFLTFLK